jgi:hypothetical protein
MAPNPNPSRITDPMWRFQERVVALEPNDFVYSGIYADKPGYHNTVERNLAKWKGEYSTRLADDLRGPRDKARGLDIKSKSAANGNYVIMAKYGNRLRAAYDRRDPRLRKWREVLGQTDADRTPEGLDFQGWYTRTPDDTHIWHFHWSILTAFVNDPEAYEAMYSILIGEPLADYQKRTGGISTMGQADDAFAREYTGVEPWVSGKSWMAKAVEAPLNIIRNHTGSLVAAAAADEVRDNAMKAALDAIAASIAAAGGNIEITPVIEAVNAVRDEARQEFAKLGQQLAEERTARAIAQARVERLSSVLANAGITLSEADDPILS